MTKDERKEQKRKEAFRKWARQHAKLRRNLRKHGGDILQSGNFKSTNSFIQHGSVSVHSHSIRVAECSLKLEKFLEKLGIHCHERDLVRGALLHDYFLYDWHDKYSHEKLHGFSPSACCAGKCESGVSADAAGTGYYPEAYVAADSVPHPALSGSMGRDDCG